MDAFLNYPWLFPTFAGLFGLIVGSFLNVVIHRLPIMMENEWRRECNDTFAECNLAVPEETFNLSVPRSKCPSCQHPIAAYDNIPVFSWLWLKGKCRHCDASISPRYPLVELCSAVLCTAVAAHFGFSVYSIALLAFTLILIAAVFIDFDTLLLPDQLTLPLMWLGVFASLSNISPVSLESSIIGAMAGYLSLWSVYWLFKLITGKEGMGYGDFKLLAALGAWLGWQLLPMVVLLSSLVGLVFGLVQLRMQKQGIDKAFPFGPYLAIAGWCALMWGSEITQWYFTSVLGI
ncbi:prepilin peptidase [Vibrio sonorensis]|uniref:prepilin peptidase n=1 Tax=Vibrio sonorensis TaxID=1004316 RepID=UPI0008D94FC0|nr:A24 family peptidase [Vibrio sonorensis]